MAHSFYRYNPPVGKRILITGAGGQDGLIAAALTAQNNQVTALLRSASTHSAVLEELNCQVRYLDLCDSAALRQFIAANQFDLVLHFAAMSSQAQSFTNPSECFEINAHAVTVLLEALLRFQPECRLIVAGSSLMFCDPELAVSVAYIPSFNNRSDLSAQGSNPTFASDTGPLPRVEVPADLGFPIAPASPYGASKAFAYWSVKAWRQRGLAAQTAVFFNHESPLRPQQFVTSEIVAAACEAKLWAQSTMPVNDLKPFFEIRDMHAARDFSWAGDLLRQLLHRAGEGVADSEAVSSCDFVLGSGVSHDLGEICDFAFSALGLEFNDFLKLPSRSSLSAQKKTNLSDSAMPRRVLVAGEIQTDTNYGQTHSAACVAQTFERSQGLRSRIDMGEAIQKMVESEYEIRHCALEGSPLNEFDKLKLRLHSAIE